MFHAQIQKIGVVGAGQMGTGIAIVANRKGEYPVTIVDSNETSLANSKKFIESHFNKEISKKKMTQNDKDLFMSRFSFSKSLSDLSNTNFVIEVLFLFINQF